MNDIDNINLLSQYLNSRNNYPFNIISSILDLFNSIIIEQVNQLHTKGVKIDYWQHPMEALCFKLSSHIASFRKLLEKSSLPFGNSTLDIFDISSINIICRAIIENYLTLYHFHFDAIAKDHKEFRFLIYAISALKNRQLFTPSAHESEIQHEKDRIEITKFENHLKSNSYFKSSSLKNQKNYLTTKNARQLPWIDLLDNSDLKPEMFKDTWRLQSNYAHSEFLSVLQIRDFMKNPAQLNSSTFVMAELVAIIISITIKNVEELFSEAKKVIELLDEDTKNLLQYFLLVGTKNSMPERSKD